MPMPIMDMSSPGLYSTPVIGDRRKGLKSREKSFDSTEQKKMLLAMEHSEVVAPYLVSAGVDLLQLPTYVQGCLALYSLRSNNLG